jgi:hypothetical protein
MTPQTEKTDKQKKVLLILQVSGVAFMTIYFIANSNPVINSHFYIRQSLMFSFIIVNLFVSIRFKLLNVKLMLIYALIALGLIIYRIYLK